MAVFVLLHLGLVGVIQGIKTIGILLLMAFECSFAQRGHSLALALRSSVEAPN
jgi:hypothetical protein